MVNKLIGSVVNTSLCLRTRLIYSILEGSQKLLIEFVCNDCDRR